MKITCSPPLRLSIQDLTLGDVFRFINGLNDQAYQIDDMNRFHSLVTGLSFPLDGYVNSLVIRFPDAQIELGSPEGG